MRILVEKAREGKRVVTVIPARRAHLPPLQLSGLTRATLRENLGPVLADVDARERVMSGRAPGRAT